MEIAKVKVEAEDLMLRDEEILVRKRGRQGKNHDENKSQGRGQSNGRRLKTGESDREKENLRGSRKGLRKKAKGLDNVIIKEEGCENWQDDVHMRENGGSVGGDIDSLVEGSKDSDVSSSAEAEKAHCSGRKEVEEGDIGGEREEGNGSEKEMSKVEIEGQRSRAVRMSRKLALEKIERLSSLTDDEDEGISKRGKKRGPGKKNNNGTSNGVGAKIAQMEDEKAKQRKDETVTKTRVGLKKDKNVDRIWKVLELISLHLSCD